MYRAPSTKLVLDLLQLQDELAIIEHISKSQIEIVAKLEQHIGQAWAEFSKKKLSNNQEKALFSLGDPDGLINRLTGELQDLSELRTNTSELVTRTIQLVNVRFEDHSQAILVFTIVTVIFLPLSFLTSFFGMNVSDIRSMSASQWVFWTCAASLTSVVVVASTFFAFYGGRLNEKFVVWRDSQDFDYQRIIFDRFRRRAPRQQRPKSATRPGIRVLDATHADANRGWDFGLAAS